MAMDELYTRIPSHQADPILNHYFKDPRPPKPKKK
jgi:hypothetical protein